VNRKAELDAADEGGVPELDINYPPHDAPLYWEDFKAWAKVDLPEYSLAVVDEQLADPIVAAGLQCYRAGRMARRHTMPGGKKSDEDFEAWTKENLYIRSSAAEGLAVAKRCYSAGLTRKPRG
jgi:hypothetical protein